MSGDVGAAGSDAFNWSWAGYAYGSIVVGSAALCWAIDKERSAPDWPRRILATGTGMAVGLFRPCF